jgi:hypothetical protein
MMTGRPGVGAPSAARALRHVETCVTAIHTQRRAATSSTLRVGVFTLCTRSTPYGARVSGAMENRAAVFTSQPQAVEVYQAGTWWAGELLGWRHDADGSCQVWVRVVLGGVEETAWTDLATLRLPERHLSVAAPPTLRGPSTQEMSVARHPSGRRARSADESAVTASLPKVPELSVVPDPTGAAARPGGRRRAPEEAVPSGGRRRAPEEAVEPVGGRRRAPEDAVAVARVDTPSSGRHRAPGDPGRHRTADTGLLPVVAQAALPARPEVAAAPSRETWTAPEGLEADLLLTRPMRLSDHMQSRRPRLGGSLRV